MHADPLVRWGVYSPGMEREHDPVSPCSHFIFQGLKISLVNLGSSVCMHTCSDNRPQLPY